MAKKTTRKATRAADPRARVEVLAQTPGAATLEPIAGRL